MHSYYNTQTPMRNIQVPVYDYGSSYFRPVSQIPLSGQQSQIYQRQPSNDQRRKETNLAQQSQKLRSDPQIDSIIEKYRKSYDQRQTEKSYITQSQIQTQQSHPIKQQSLIRMTNTQNSGNFQFTLQNPMSSSIDQINFPKTGSVIKSNYEAQKYQQPSIISQKQRNPYLSDEDEFNDFKPEQFEHSTPLALKMSQKIYDQNQSSNQISAPSTSKSEMNRMVEQVVLPSVEKTINNPAIKKQVAKLEQAAENDQVAKMAILGICGLIVLFIFYELIK